MTTIKTTCPTCGTVELSVQQMSLELSEGGVSGRYSFVCPSCVEPHTRPAGQRVALLLQAAGVPQRTPEEGQPITESEIAAFSRALHGEPAPTRRL